MSFLTKVHVVAHTHWDFEWYFTRQEAKVQFAFHMDEVFTALENNQLDYYVLDGQMSILDDYLADFPEKRTIVQNYVTAGRLFVGPWYTQIDEMVTSGESIIRNLRLGMDGADELGAAMAVGYLPDSFGQSQDMPKIYHGLGVNHALFWRGTPKEVDKRYFYWRSNDGSQILTANIKNGYFAGVDLIETDQFKILIQNITTKTNDEPALLPVGGDQRPVDFNLKERIAKANAATDDDVEFLESSYPAFFDQLEKEELKTISGEFIDPSLSKIHRGIYSSRADLKQLYDRLERTMIYQVEPLSAMASQKGLELKQGLIDDIWKTIARGQAHDSSGACNSDKTNQDIKQRGLNALQMAVSLRDYLLRKMSISVTDNELNDLFIWNPLPVESKQIRQFSISTKAADFSLFDQNGDPVPFDIISQEEENAAVLRRNPEEMANDFYYLSEIAFSVTVPATDFYQFHIEEGKTTASQLSSADNTIENEYYILSFNGHGLDLYDKSNKKTYADFLTFEDSGDEGDNYDYSPAFADWILALDFSQAETRAKQGDFVSTLALNGKWLLPYDLTARKEQSLNGEVAYELSLALNKEEKAIDISLQIDNQILDHRLRLVFNTDVRADYSYADTPFGVIKRPVEDPHLKDWQAIGYKEEPSSMRPMIHFANTHNDESSWSFISKGAKDFQLIGEDYKQLAVTVLRGVGYLGRPDLFRRPGDASGLQTTVVPTPDSQLQGASSFKGRLVIEENYDATALENHYVHLTQEGLYYQRQNLNQFTTPIEYFAINQSKHSITHDSLFELENLQVVFSSMQITKDQTGYELRLYNPTDQEVLVPGNIVCQKTSSISQLNLRGQQLQQLTMQVDHYHMEAFGPGEIRTYGIYPQND